jgi:hypothetical protein
MARRARRHRSPSSSEDPRSLNERGGEEHAGKRDPEAGETGKRDREAARGGAEQIAELVGGGTHRHHRHLVLGGRVHPERARNHRAPSVDERHEGDDGQGQRGSGAHGSEHDDRAALHSRERRQQAGRRASGMAACGEGAREHGDRGGAEAERDGGRREAVAAHEQRARIRQDAGPCRVREQLAGGEAGHIGPPPGGDGVAGPPRRSVRRTLADERERSERDDHRQREPGGTPVDRGDGADDRHAHDPSGRHADDGPGEDVRAPRGRRPLARGGDAGGDQQAHADAEDRLRDGEHLERRRDRAGCGAERDEGSARGEQVAQTGAAGSHGQEDGGQAAGGAGDRAKLAGGPDIASELAGDVGQDRRKHEQRRLRREQAEEQDGAGLDDAAAEAGHGSARRRHAGQRPAGAR